MKNIKKVLQHFFSNSTNKILFIITIVLAIFFFAIFKKAFIVLLLIFLSWIIKSYQKYVNIHLGIDFIMVATILPAYAYEPFTGAFAGVMSMFLSSLWRGRFNMVIFFAYVLLVIIAYITPFLASFLSITQIGIMLTLVYDALIAFFSISLLGGRIERAITFVVTHLGFNIFLFTLVAPKLLVIL